MGGLRGPRGSEQAFTGGIIPPWGLIVPKLGVSAVAMNQGVGRADCRVNADTQLTRIDAVMGSVLSTLLLTLVRSKELETPLFVHSLFLPLPPTSTKLPFKASSCKSYIPTSDKVTSSFRSKTNQQPMSSPPPSPLSARPPLAPRLSVHSISNVFVKMRQTREKSKAHHITCTSGSEPITTPSLATPNSVSLKQIPITHRDQFVCIGGVDLKRLIRAARAALYHNAENLGANVLVDEQ